jgi:hypothetical protein
MEVRVMIKLYESDYQLFIGKPYLLIAGRDMGTNFIFEIYGILLKDDGNCIIKSTVYSYRKDENLLTIFHDMYGVFEKDVFSHSENLLFYKVLLSEVDGRENCHPIKPELKEIDKSYLNVILQRCPHFVERIRGHVSTPELQDYLYNVQPIVFRIVDESEL